MPKLGRIGIILAAFRVRRTRMRNLTSYKHLLLRPSVVIVRRQLAFVTTAVGTINFEYVADRFGQHLVILRAKQPLDRSLVAARAFKWFTLTRAARFSPFSAG
jgi:hypothetical protein